MSRPCSRDASCRSLSASFFTPRAAAVLLLPLFVAALATPGSAGDVFLHPAENVSESVSLSTSSQVSPQTVAWAAGSVAVVWAEQASDAQHPELRLRRRRGDGWAAAPRSLTADDGAYSGEPALAAGASGRLHVAWVDARGGGLAIWEAAIVPGGETLESPRRLGGGTLVMEPAIAVGPDGELYVAWTSMQAMTYEILLASWTRAGGWSEPLMLSEDDRRASTQPALAVGPEGALHAVWTDRHGGQRAIAYRVLRDGHWGPIRALGQRLGPGKLARPSVAVDPSGNVHFVWQEAERRVVYARWPAGAEGPAAPLLVAGAESAARVPALAVGLHGTAHVVWEDARSPTAAERPHIGIGYARIEGGRVTAARLLSNPESASNASPSICTDPDGGVHIVWKDLWVGNGDIIYRQAGLTFGPGAPGAHHDD